MIRSGSGSSAPFSLPPWLFNFPPCPAWKQEKEERRGGGGEERRRKRGPDKVNRDKKQVASVFPPAEVLHIHEQPALDRLKLGTASSMVASLSLC